MKWNEAINNYPNKWLLFEAIEAHSIEGKRVIKDLSVIKSFDDSKEALKEYSEMHKKDKSREMYVYHTKNSELTIEERNWIGVRKYG
jgi:O-methyltransferase involved in polyketide biosynthesis